MCFNSALILFFLNYYTASGVRKNENIFLIWYDRGRNDNILNELYLRTTLFENTARLSAHELRRTRESTSSSINISPRFPLRVLRNATMRLRTGSFFPLFAFIYIYFFLFNIQTIRRYLWTKIASIRFNYSAQCRSQYAQSTLAGHTWWDNKNEMILKQRLPRS